jgi:hypothetical protein
MPVDAPVTGRRYRWRVPDTWLTLKQAAAASKVTPALVLALCRAGIVRARAAAGRWWVHGTDFATWTGRD